MKVCIYARVSTEDQNLETQLSACRDYCKRLDYEISNEYKDIISGSKDSRPAFNQLIEDLRQNKFEAVIVYKLDRIGRSLQHLLNLFEEFQNRKIEFISITQNINTTTPKGKLFLRMLMILAEYERELIVARTKSGLDRARKQGKLLGRPKGAKDKKRRKLGGYFLRYKK